MAHCGGPAARLEAAAAEEVPRYETFLDYGTFGPTSTVTLDLERKENLSTCTVVAASHIKINKDSRVWPVDSLQRQFPGRDNGC